MDRNRSWSALIVSNVLLTVPVMVCFAVMGWLCADVAIWFDDAHENYFPPTSAENIRASCLEVAIVAGFLIAQICFAARVFRTHESLLPQWPIAFRFRLSTGLIVMFAASGLLWLNFHQHTNTETGGYTHTTTGWPLIYYFLSQWSGSAPTEYYRTSDIFIDIAFCLVLLFILLVVIEFFFSLKRVAPAAQLSESESTKKPESA